MSTHWSKALGFSKPEQVLCSRKPESSVTRWFSLTGIKLLRTAKPLEHNPLRTNLASKKKQKKNTHDRTNEKRDFARIKQMFGLTRKPKQWCNFHKKKKKFLIVIQKTESHQAVPLNNTLLVNNSIV